LGAIKKGCSEQNIDLVDAKKNELSIIFDNLWKDSTKISKLSQGISYGFTLTLGFVGTLITLPVGGWGGLLSSLGYKILEDKIAPAIPDKLAKVLSPSYLVSINDFKQKYRIPE